MTELSRAHPLVELFRAVGSDAQRARVLLAMPHAVLLENAMALCAVCTAAGFRRGAEFVMAREAYALAVLDSRGGNPLEGKYRNWRARMAAIAAEVPS